MIRFILHLLDARYSHVAYLPSSVRLSVCLSETEEILMQFSEGEMHD